MNDGFPYQWGGFDTPAEFDRKIAAGHAAGDIYTPAKRAALESAVSAEACGIDCSGLISRCWRLDRSYSTRELASLCTPLSSLEDLRPVDILNVHNAYVLGAVHRGEQGLQKRFQVALQAAHHQAQLEHDEHDKSQPAGACAGKAFRPPAMSLAEGRRGAIL